MTLKKSKRTKSITGSFYQPAVFLVFGIILLTNACSNNNSPTEEDTTTQNDTTQVPNRISIVKLGSIAGSDNKIIDASFLELSEMLVPSTVDAIVDSVLPAPGNCSISSENPISLIATNTLDVGDNIILSSDAGTYGTIERKTTERRGIYYSDTLFLDGPFPTTLTLDVTNEDFQSYNGLALMTTSGLTSMISPAVQTGIFVDTEYQWNRSASANDLYYIIIWVTSGDVITNEVLCALPESGSFRLPEETLTILRARNEIGSNNNIGTLRSMGRAKRHVTNNNGSMFITLHLHLSEGVFSF